MSRNVLILPANATALHELLVVARYLRDETDLTPVLVLPDGAAAPALAAEGIEAVVAGGAVGPSRVGKRGGWKDLLKRSPISYRIQDALAATLPWMAVQAGRVSRSLERLRREAEALCDRYRPAALLLADDRTFGLQLLMRQVCEERKIPVVLIPVAVSTPEGSVFIRRGKRQFRAGGWGAPLLNRWVARRCPDQVFESQGHRYIFYTGGMSRALAAAGLLQGNPWYLGGSSQATVAVGGPGDAERFRRYGLAPERIVPVGQPSLDGLHAVWREREARRTELLQRYALSADRRLILCAVPQLGEHNILPWDQHWRETRFLVETLSGTGAHVLLSLHPKARREEYLFLEQEYGCVVLQEPLRDVLPAADLFVATFSSTVLWSVLCELPAVVVDFWGFGYTDFDELKGVVKVTERTELAGVLRRVLSEPGIYRRLQELQRGAGERTLLFDGGCCRRIAALLEGGSP